VGVRDGRALLLSPIEIRYAEARRHDVWLATDRGWLRAATHGLGNVGAGTDQVRLRPDPPELCRQHRTHLRIEHHGKGVLTLSTDPRKQEALPVSRRYTAELKGLLGL
jgi:sigma-54 dependent transcriptional regulator, acetoin dehydrogenase operon transcriptional activator AcoR